MAATCLAESFERSWTGITVHNTGDDKQIGRFSFLLSSPVFRVWDLEKLFGVNLSIYMVFWVPWVLEKEYKILGVVVYWRRIWKKGFALSKDSQKKRMAKREHGELVLIACCKEFIIIHLRNLLCMVAMREGLMMDY